MRKLLKTSVFSGIQVRQPLRYCAQYDRIFRKDDGILEKYDGIFGKDDRILAKDDGISGKYHRLFPKYHRPTAKDDCPVPKDDRLFPPRPRSRPSSSKFLKNPRTRTRRTIVLRHKNCVKMRLIFPDVGFAV